MNLLNEIDELSRDFCMPLEPQGVMDALVLRLVDRYAMAAAAIWRLDPVQWQLALAASAGDPPLPASLNEIPAGHTLLGKALQTNLPQLREAAAGAEDDLAQLGGTEPLPVSRRVPAGGRSPDIGCTAAGCSTSAG